MTTNDAGLLRVGSGLLRRLHTVLDRQFGDQAAPALQEAGFAAGEELYDAWAAWVGKRSGVADPGQLDATHLGKLLDAFYADLGWGHLHVERLGAALAVDSDDWAEADPHAAAAGPSCHVTAGVLAGMLGRMAGEHVAVMEIECRSRGDGHCRFLAGAPETLQAVYDGVNAGRDYREVLGG
jgi:predicted hydrocarbon binding protein